VESPALQGPRDFESSLRGELPVLYRVARRLARSADDAEDLVQQTLLNAFKGWQRFDGRHLRSWLIRILRNEHAGRRKSDVFLDQTIGLEEDLSATDAPWDALAWRDHADRILIELEALPEEYRLAVHLCDVEELSYQEAAEAMGVPLGTVRSRLFRGRALIKSRMSAAGVAPGGES
jgi:RNA polymerase sigma-70 factor (ECF subfamily)